MQHKINLLASHIILKLVNFLDRSNVWIGLNGEKLFKDHL